MAKAWIEGENIFVTEDDGLIIPFPTVEVPSGTVPQDLKVVDGKLVLKSNEEKLNELKQQKIQALKQYVYDLLSQTDWVVIKCQELGLNIKTAYPEIARKRQAIRQWNNEVEEQIMSAAGLEELNEIILEFNQWILWSCLEDTE